MRRVLVAAMAALELAGCLGQVESRKSEVEGRNNSPTPPLTHSLTVLASSFGWNATNATKCLQAAFDSGSSKVVIDRQAGDWIVEPVFLRSDQEVVIENDVVVRALPGAFKGTGDCLFTARGVTNVVLRGKGNAQLRMERDAYTDRSAYHFSEWRHTLSLIDSANVRVSDLAFRFSGGDGIYVGRGSADIDIRRVDCSDHYRQGISVISARNLTIADSRFTATKGTPPQSGIDFEPNKPSEALSNCRVENCDFDGNASHGIAFYLPNLDETSEPISIVLKNCRARGNGANGLAMTVGANGKRKPVKGEIRIEDCAFSENGTRPMSVGGLSHDTASVIFRRTLFDARGSAWGGLLIGNTGLLADAANLTFDNCRIVMDGGADTPALATRRPSSVTSKGIEFSASPGVGIESIGGTLLVEQDGAAERFDFEAFAARNRPNPELRKAFGQGFTGWRDLRPIAPDATVKTATPMCRGKFTFLQYLPREGEYTMTFKAATVGNRKLNCPVLMRDMVGTDLGTFSITSAVQKVVVRASGKNLRRFEIDTRGNTVAVFSPYPGQGLLADTPFGIFRESCRLWFPVSDDGAKKAVVSLVPEEPAEATLLDAAGAVAASMPFQAASATLVGEGRAGIWSVDVKAEEDVTLRLGGDTPIFATEKTSGLVR